MWLSRRAHDTNKAIHCITDPRDTILHSRRFATCLVYNVHVMVSLLLFQHSELYVVFFGEGFYDLSVTGTCSRVHHPR